MEYFKDVPGYEGIYQVSNHGRIVNIKTERVIKPIPSRRFAYHYVSLCNMGCKRFRIHRLVLSAFRGDSSLSVNHKDFNRGNNQLANLEYITAKENTRHAIAAGRHPTANRRLSAKQVSAIRASKKSQKELAVEYGMFPANISLIKNKKSYTDVE